MSNIEWLITGMVPISAFLFAWGGGGAKWARRFVMPAVLAIGAFLLGISLAKCLIALPLMMGSLCLGYGENHPFWRKLCAILALGLCLLPLAGGINALLTLIVPLVFGANYWLSRKFNWWTHKILELSAGFSMGVVVVLLALTK